jgi:internalin A
MKTLIQLSANLGLLCALAFGLNLPSTAQTACVTPPSGLVAWWPAEGLPADAAGTNNGVLNGGVTYEVGMVGQAFSFNGTDGLISVPSAVGMTFTQEMTVEAWVKLPSLNDFYFVATKQPSGTAGDDYPGNFEFRIEPGGGLALLHQIDYLDVYQEYHSSSAITTGAWHHVAATLVSGGDVKFYVDGLAAGVFAQQGTFGITNQEPIRVGTRKDAWSYFAGAIDELSLYNRALSAYEIATIYAAGSAGKCPLSFTNIDLWLMDPEYGSGGQVSINGAVGTQTGSVTNLVWSWGDGTTNESWFPATHTYSARGNYVVLVTAYADNGERKMAAQQVAFPVYFPDPNLEAAVREALSIPTGEITASDLLDLTSLSAGGRGLTNLTGLESAANLRNLYLWDNSIVDLAPLAGLAQLESLILGYNGVTNVAALSNCWRLTSLNLFEDRVSDVSPLAGLTNLTSLDLWNNRAADISPLGGLTQLTSLSLGYNGVTNVEALADCWQLTTLNLFEDKISDAIPLAGLTNLSVLDLWNNRVSDISPLAGLTQLTSLSLGNNGVTNVEALAACWQLTWLGLANESVSDATPLAGLTNLNTLDLWENRVADISPLAALTQLTRLNLRENGVTNIQALANCTRLQELNLSMNHVTNLAPLAGCTNLTALDLWGNGATDITPLAALGNLTSLSLGQNGIANIAVLGFCPQLQALWLNGNQITDISPLAGLTNLGSLSLLDNRVSDISPLASLSRLTWLELLNNRIADIAPLAGLTNLENLNLAMNRVTNVEALASCVVLRGLRLNENLITDLTPLSGLVNLTEIYLGGNWVSDITPIASLSLLTVVELQWNFLDVGTGSASRIVIDEWLAQGVSVEFQNQSTAPRISPIDDLSVSLGTPVPVVVFRVGDNLTPASNLVVTVDSSNLLLLPSSAIVLSGDGPDRALTLTPTADQTGSTTIVVTVSDGAESSSTVFQLTVIQRPILSLTISVDGPVITVSGDPVGHYALDYASALQSNTTWEPLTNFTLTASPQNILDSTATNAPQRYYRLRWVP